MKNKYSIGGSDVTRLLNGNWFDLFLEKTGQENPKII